MYIYIYIYTLLLYTVQLRGADEPADDDRGADLQPDILLYNCIIYMYIYIYMYTYTIVLLYTIEHFYTVYKLHIVLTYIIYSHICYILKHLLHYYYTLLF